MDRFVSIFAIVLAALASQVQAQLSAPYGVDSITDGQSVVIYWFFPSVNETTLARVDEEPQSYLLYGTADAGARLASVFDLPSSICAIEAVEIRLWPDDPFPRLPGDESSPFGLAVDTALCMDTTAVPLWQEADLVAAFSITGWQRFPIRSRVPSDGVVVEFRWQVGTPTAPLPAVAFSSHFVNSYIGVVRDDRVEWSAVHDAVALMRVQVNLADIDAGRCTGGSAPDSFSVFVFDSPEEIDPEEPVIVTVSDSLHVVLDRTDSEGKLVAVAAWRDNVMSQKSEIFRIDVSTDVAEEILPEGLSALEQNYPNPFNDQTVISSDRNEEVVIYDLLGREMRRLQAINHADNGPFRFEWNGKSGSGIALPSGVYFYRQEGSAKVKKLVLLR